MLPVVWIALAIASNGAPAGLGVIEGALLFPACDLPKDLEVCAEDTNGHLTCTGKLRMLDKTVGYRLEVPPGDYRVFTRTESTLPGVRAYYTEAVRCGLDVSCNNHTPIAVSVKSGARLLGINPADWSEPDEPALFTYVN